MLSASLAHRSQYVGLGTKAIGTQFFSLSSPVFSSKYGVGLRLLNDFIGYQRFTKVEVLGAYHILQGKHNLSAGFSIGMVQLSLDGSQLTAPDGTYIPGVVIHNDEFLPGAKIGSFAPSMSLGMIYAYKNFELGMAVQDLNKPRVNLSEEQSGTIIFLNRTINIHSSFVIKTKNVKIIPSVYSKTDFVKWQAQGQVMVDWKKILVGLGFRGYNGLNNDAVIAMFGFRIKNNFQVAYSYDYNLSYLNNSNSGSHEISLKYDIPVSFKQNVKTNMMFNPRFL